MAYARPPKYHSQGVAPSRPINGLVRGNKGACCHQVVEENMSKDNQKIREEVSHLNGARCGMQRMPCGNLSLTGLCYLCFN